MISKPKANSVIAIEPILDSIGNVCGIQFNVAGAGSVQCTLEGLSAEVKARAMIHGIIQRISDAAALSRDSETGLSATPSEKLDAMRELVDHYMSGTSEWSRKREGGTREGGLLFTCLMELYPEAGAEKIRARIKGWKPAERASVLESAAVKAIADRIRAKATAGIDAEDLLATI